MIAGGTAMDDPFTVHPDIFDPSAALEQVGGDEELLYEMVELFIKTYHEDISQIEAAMREMDMEKLRRAAHRIKGSVGNFGRKRAFQAACALERCAGEDREDAPVCYAKLREELTLLNGSFLAYIMSRGPIGEG